MFVSECLYPIKMFCIPDKVFYLNLKQFAADIKLAETTGFESDIKLYQKQVIWFLLQICFVMNYTPVLVPYY